MSSRAPSPGFRPERGASLREATPPTHEELSRRLERERKARRLAEEIAETATRDLYAAIQQLRQANEELDQRVEQRTADLAAAYLELEAFSYSISHDLREPLRGIDGLSQVLLEDYSAQLDSVGRGYLERIRAATHRLTRLIDAILTLSRVSRAELHIGTVDLSAAAREIAAELERAQPEREVTFVMADNLVARGDPDLLRNALQNLLQNAWKFTRRHPTARIEFGSTQRDGQRVYYVRDDGAGFDDTEAANLFRPFERLHDRAEFEGDGIGLATVQRILTRHRGQIWAEGAVEQGAVFYFTFGEDL